MKTEEYKYEWGTPEATREMKKMTPGQNEASTTPQDKDIAHKKGTQPSKYYAGLSKNTKSARDAHFKKYGKMKDKDPNAYKPAPGDKSAKTKPSVHTLAYKRRFGENKLPVLLMSKKVIAEEHGQVTYDGIITSNFDICPSAVTAFSELIEKAENDEIFLDFRYHKHRLEQSPFIKQRELLKTAIEATDNYLGVEKRAKNASNAFAVDVNEFNHHLKRAVTALKLLGQLENHSKYMETHTDAISELSNYTTDDYYSKPDSPGEMEVDTPDYDQKTATMYESKSSGLAAKAKASGISLSVLRKVYNRGMAAWKTGHRPGTTPQQWAMARVNSYINKGKGTYHGADKDLREEEEEFINEVVNNIQWEDLLDFYTPDELVEEEVETTTLDEIMSISQRYKGAVRASRFKSKRGQARAIKLKRASDPATLRRRAGMAARRMIYKRILHGRSKSSLSPAEKERVEKQAQQYKALQNTLAARLIPVVRSTEMKRLSHKGGAKPYKQKIKKYKPASVNQKRK